MRRYKVTRRQLAPARYPWQRRGRWTDKALAVAMWRYTAQCLRRVGEACEAMRYRGWAEAALKAHGDKLDAQNKALAEKQMHAAGLFRAISDRVGDVLVIEAKGWRHVVEPDTYRIIKSQRVDS